MAKNKKVRAKGHVSYKDLYIANGDVATVTEEQYKNIQGQVELLETSEAVKEAEEEAKEQAQQETKEMEAPRKTVMTTKDAKVRTK